VLATRGRGFEPLVTVVCCNCGLVSHQPLPSPEALTAFYATRYRIAYKGTVHPKPKHALRALDGAIARARRLIPLIGPSARVLDIGASSGEFTLVMGGAGCRARGLEPNLGYAAFARATYGVDVVAGRFEDAEIEPGTLDLVTLTHVLEHLADPWDALGRIARWLVPEGLVFVEVPNLAGLRKHASNTFHRAHVWNFTPETLLQLAWQAGFVALSAAETRGTSVVFRRRVSDDQSPVGIGPELAERIFAQVTQEQSTLAYLRSGAPFSRRWQRLRRNIAEALVLRRVHDWPDFARRRIAAARLPALFAAARVRRLDDRRGARGDGLSADLGIRPSGGSEPEIGAAAPQQPACGQDGGRGAEQQERSRLRNLDQRQGSLGAGR
jgi:2-polyprenyl-3-methyl-5-hydroxy-6-metoxy-1,4-benzoquinol methylase